VGEAGSRQNPSAEGELRDQSRRSGLRRRLLQIDRSRLHNLGAPEYSAPFAQFCYVVRHLRSSKMGDTPMTAVVVTHAVGNIDPWLKGEGGAAVRGRR
jgi:hypothetical protein